MKTIDANLLKEMLISGANNLYNHYPEVDQLNVFPVPDGDTGMNMNLTATSGMKEIQNREFENVYDVAKCFSKGLLFGARGNSGVITSQIFRGFSNALEGKVELYSDELAQAFVSGKEVAYKAVLKPVEGTILTVIRESSTAMVEQVERSMSIEEAMEILLESAKDSLKRTPELLPVLKDVGVVDSGGAGLVYILEGMSLATKGIFIERKAVADDQAATAEVVSPYAGAKLTEDEEGYGYCTQFILRLGASEDMKRPFVEKTFKKFLSTHGNSLVMVRDDDIVKVHVHTLTPGNMLTYAQQYGEFVSITIENMSEEHHNIEHGFKATDMESNIAKAKEEKAASNVSLTSSSQDNGELKEYGIIAVSSGEGLNEVFKELGVDEVVTGGQTMNPSTQDFITAINKIKAKNIFILPNNSNIVLAATQACDVLEGEEISARVIPSKTIPQGISALMQFNPEATPDEVFSDMKSALKMVRSGSVTYAIKDTDIEGIHITKGFYMAMKDKNIISCVKDKLLALTDLIDSLINEECFILTIFLGEDITEEEEASITEEITSKYSEMLDVDIKRGGQPVYSFIVGVE